jgi:hypothetical protein
MEGLAPIRANPSAMISSEVQRTLVKSPPELWAELSDPAALARHLGELGNIRIVRTEPESTVEWAAENTTGTVSIRPSGWGTKVTLSVTRELASATPEAVNETAATDEANADTSGEPVASATDAAAPDAAPWTLELEPTGDADALPDPSPEVFPEPELASEQDTVAAVPELASEPETPAAERAPANEPEPRRGFFARLFGRRRREASSSPIVEAFADVPADVPAVEESALNTSDSPTPDAFAAVSQVLEPQTFAAEHPFAAVAEVRQPAPKPIAEEEPVSDADPRQTGDIAAELLAAEEAGTEEVTAVLTAVLDRLGAAHHRPFSRS